MECATRNSLILSYLESQADRAAAELAARRDGEEATRELMARARSELSARRRALLDHCEQHGC